MTQSWGPIRIQITGSSKCKKFLTHAPNPLSSLRDTTPPLPPPDPGPSPGTKPMLELLYWVYHSHFNLLSFPTPLHLRSLEVSLVPLFLHSNCYHSLTSDSWPRSKNSPSWPGRGPPSPLRRSRTRGCPTCGTRAPFARPPTRACRC